MSWESGIATLPLTFFVIAMVAALVQRLVFPSTRTALLDTAPQNRDDAIFVALVSYDDPQIVRFVKYLLSRAAQPSRIHFGVVEYVSTSSASTELQIPDALRPNVYFHTKSLQSAESSVLAFHLCVSKAYRQEKYVCLMGPCAVEDNWDESLCNLLTTERDVLTVPLANVRVPAFLSCRMDRTQQIHRALHGIKQPSRNTSVPSVLAHPEFLFGHAKAMQKILKGVYRIPRPDDADLALTLQIRSLGYFLKSPAFLIAVQGDTPNPIPPSKKNTEDDGSLRERFIALLSLDDRHKRVYAKIGLTMQPTDEECIAKYGSVAASRIKLEMNSSSKSKISEL